MTYYISLYAFSILLLISGGTSVFRKFRNPSGFFFLLLTVFLSIWFVIYFLFFGGISDPGVLLRLSRMDFGTGLLIMYSLVLFIFYFSTKPSKLPVRDSLVIAGLFMLLFAFPAVTTYVVPELVYDPSTEVYREVTGSLYPMYTGLHLLAIGLFVFFSFRQLRKQRYLDKLRLKRIVVSTFTLLGSMVFLLVVLPAFGIWILEKEIVFMLAIYVVYILYTVRRYYFSVSAYGIGPVLVGITSVALSVLALYVVKNFYLPGNTSSIANYWLSDSYSIFDTTVGIAIFVAAYALLKKLFLGSAYLSELEWKVLGFHEVVARATSVERLADTASRWMKGFFKTKFCELRIFPEWAAQTELQKFFEENPSENIFVNDVVFIEDKKSKFDKAKIRKELPKDAFLVIPFYSNSERANVQGLFIMGPKAFGDPYSIEEIKIIRKFVFGLGLHIKYIHAYRKIEDFSINLDHKVDEKTIEYNNLINKQKEFISVISHEVKSPIANAIFQADSILDDLEKDELAPDQLKSELEMLNAQLIRTGELITTLFSVQYFDIHSVSLFRENVQIDYLLETEYEVYSRMHEHIRFVNEIDKVGFAYVDRIQLQQVISNLLNNAVKFADKENPSILIEAYKNDGSLFIAIEDNGKWFGGIDPAKLFEKYSTFGGSDAIGLGMGLYLCKKIVDMHGWEITASVSKKLGWARFGMRIPLK